MERRQEYPNTIRGLAAAGTDALRASMDTFADWQIRDGRRLDPSLTTPEDLAGDLLDGLAYPEHSFGALSEEAQDRVARGLGLPARSDWAPAQPVPEGTPAYRMPSWESDVYAVLYLRVSEPPPTPREPADAQQDPSGDWPQFASVTAWSGTRAKAAAAKALAKRLGPGWSVQEPHGDLRLPVLVNDRLDLSFVVVPGGTMTMGLTKADRAAAARTARRHGTEASEHLTALTKACRPTRTVHVGPFLCSRTPLLDRHASLLGVDGDAGNVHRVLRAGSAAAATAVPEGYRLPSEAEWEWLARDGSERTWLSGDVDPREWAARVLAGPLEDDAGPFGVHGLGWGEWVDDGWHPTYRGAPPTSRAWEPMSRPEVVRGGCLALWPWQGGEALLALSAGRDRGGSSATHAIRLVRDLPPR